MFQKLLGLQGAPISRFAEFCPSFCKFILSSYYADMFRKYLHKYFHMSFVSSQGGTPNKKTQKKIKGRKAGRSIFIKTSSPVLFALGMGIIMPYSLGVLV